MLPKSLPMTVFEEYMLLDGTPAYPMACHVRCRFSGGFDHALAEEAFEAALLEHPLFYSKCRETKPYRYAWEIPTLSDRREDRIRHGKDFSEVLGVRLYWLEGKCRDPQYPKETREPMEIFAETMLRIFAVEEKDASGTVVRTDLILKWHHSSSDGKGIYRFWQDFLMAYARKCGIEMPEWENVPKLVPETLIDRHKCGLTFWGRVRQFLICMAHLPRSMNFLFRKVRPLMHYPESMLTPNGKDAEPDSVLEDYPLLLFRKLTREETSLMLQKCKEKKCTFNDALLHAVWAGTKYWQEKNPEIAYSGKNPWIRLAIPCNLRLPHQEDVPACNVVSMVFADRKAKEIDYSDSFLAGVHRNLQRIKKFSLGFLLLQSMTDARVFAGNLHKAVKIRDCWSTVVFTNPGILFSPKAVPFPRTEDGRIKIGEKLTLDEIDSASPIRSMTNISMSCVTYAGEAQFSMIYDTRLMKRADAESYMDEILLTLRTILGII